MSEERGGARSIGSLANVEREHLLEGASEERLQQLHAAEDQRKVFEAWNTVCGGTREGVHVTGLHYLAESNELLVYMDSAAWTQEMTMLREIIRARMERAGAKVDGLIFKTSRRPRQNGGASMQGRATAREEHAPREDLTAEERTEVVRMTSQIDDPKLKKALEKAMVASLEWSKATAQSKNP